MEEVLIVGAVRTAIGAFQGSLASMGATELGAVVIREALRRSALEPSQVDEVIMGQVLPHGYGQNPARQAAIKAGLPWEVGCTTVNKVCGSGLKAVMMGAQAIRCGDAQVVVAGGMESMSRAPYMLERARAGYRMGHATVQDAMIHDGLWDHVNDFHMGISNDLCSQRYGVSREDQDRYAAESYRRALEAISQGRFKEQIVPVEVPRPKGAPVLFDTDECPRPTDYETLAAMRPAFQKEGFATAGNSSIISDGAAAVVLVSEKRARQLGLKALAMVGAQGSAGLDMKYVLVAPILSIPKVAAKQGLSPQDIDLHEINEAFSGSTVAVIRELGLDPGRVNVYGGAVALGHPIGASGARVLTTLLYAMRDKEAKMGMATLCLGGGEAVSLLVQRD